MACSLNDDVLYRVLDYLSQEDVHTCLAVPRLQPLAQELINHKAVINLYYRPNYRELTQGCREHSMEFPPVYNQEWSFSLPFSSRDTLEQYGLDLSIFHRINLFFVIGEFFDDSYVEGLKFLSTMLNKNVLLHIHWRCQFDYNCVERITNIVKDNRVRIYMFAKCCHGGDYSIGNYGTEITLCCRRTSIIPPVRILVNSETTKLGIRAHYEYSEPFLSLEPSMETSMLTDLALDSATIDISMVAQNFPALEKLKLERSTAKDLLIFNQFRCLRHLEIFNATINEMTPVSLNIPLKSFHFQQIKGISSIEYLNFPHCTQTIDVSRNSLEKFSCTNYGPLLTLDLSYNCLTTIELCDQFVDTIDLLYNQRVLSDIVRFGNIDLARRLFTSCRRLIMRGCHITDRLIIRLGELMADEDLQYTVEEWILSINKIILMKSFEAPFYHQLPLQSLGLAFNNFTKVASISHPSLGVVDFTGNKDLILVTLSDSVLFTINNTPLAQQI